jgi:membrane-associated progesterone receptor component
MLLAFIDLTFENILWVILAFVVAYLAKSILTPPPPPPAPRPARKPIDMREFTIDELKNFAGQDATTPIYLALKGKIYDVSRGRSFYGPGGAYPRDFNNS